MTSTSSKEQADRRKQIERWQSLARARKLACVCCGGPLSAHHRDCPLGGEAA